MNSPYIALGLAWCLLGGGIAAGCAAVDPKPYSRADTPERLLSKQIAGIGVSVDAIVEPARSQKYFGTDAFDEGIVAIYVRVENASGVGSILVEKERFKILINGQPEGPSGPPQGERPGAVAGEAVTIASAVLGASPPLMIIGGSMISTADMIRHNFIAKELRNQSLAPGRSVEGFVYAQRSTKTESTKHLSVIVPIKNLETEIDTIFEFSIGYDR